MSLSASISATTAKPTVNASQMMGAYRRMAPVYDWIFGPSLERGRRSAARALAPQPGDHVLEVGIGTGLTLRHWPRECAITGIDLNAAMLARAERAKARIGRADIRLLPMDAERMTFPDDQFDCITVMYVVSVVERPAVLLDEVVRVARPGARVVILNHFQSQSPIVRRAERLVARIGNRIGFDSALPLAAVQRTPGLVMQPPRPANLFGYWTLLVATVAK